MKRPASNTASSRCQKKPARSSQTRAAKVLRRRATEQAKRRAEKNARYTPRTNWNKRLTNSVRQVRFVAQEAKKTAVSAHVAAEVAKGTAIGASVDALDAKADAQDAKAMAREAIQRSAAAEAKATRCMDRLDVCDQTRGYVTPHDRGSSSDNNETGGLEK